MRRCIHCNRPADPAVGGAPKCKRCTLLRIVMFLVVLSLIVYVIALSIWRHL